MDCKVCGYVEAAHECDPADYPGVCNCYGSPDPEWEAAEWRRVRGEDQQHDRRQYSDAVWILTPYGPIDIGS